MKIRALLAAAVITSCRLASAGDDIWEVDDSLSVGVDNTLFHGAPPQVHNIGPWGDFNTGFRADEDWFILVARPQRSYEVLVSSAAGLNRHLEARDVMRTNGFVGVQDSAGLATGRVRTLRWIEPDPVVSTHVLVSGNVHMRKEAIYTIQFRETTLYCPRYNNTATQGSILIVQHTAPEGVTGGLCQFAARFHDSTGNETGSTSQALFLNASKVISTKALTGATSGSAFIAHTCGWGGLKAKIVALEPATGFSFDTVCTPREN